MEIKRTAAVVVVSSKPHGREHKKRRPPPQRGATSILVTRGKGIITGVAPFANAHAAAIYAAIRSMADDDGEVNRDTLPPDLAAIVAAYATVRWRVGMDVEVLGLPRDYGLVYNHQSTIWQIRDDGAVVVRRDWFGGRPTCFLTYDDDALVSLDQ
jgi:hypothetical protein